MPDIDAPNVLTNAATAGRVSLLGIALCCPAAPGLGCGIAAKPVLGSIARVPSVRSVWLNRCGTMLAVEWQDPHGPSNVDAVVAQVAAHGLHVDVLHHDAHDAAPARLELASEWVEQADLDRLSAQEARVIAQRLARRLDARRPLGEGTRTRLTKALEGAAACVLFGPPTPVDSVLFERLTSALRDAARSVLDSDVLDDFGAALALGHRPVADEH